MLLDALCLFDYDRNDLDVVEVIDLSALAQLVVHECPCADVPL